MKANVNIIYVDQKPLEFSSGEKIFKHKFCDVDGLVGTFYSKNVYKIGDSVKVELVNNGDNYKFSVVK